MLRYFAFLRAINVGGRNVTNEVLRKAFEALGLQEVESFIASGNIVFSSGSGEAAALERKIETGLLKTLGYEVKTFLRGGPELAGIANHLPFPPAEVSAAHALYVGFVAQPLLQTDAAKLAQFNTEVDDFRTRGREIYWKCLQRQTDSKFSNAAFERALKISATWRNINTVQRLATKYGL